VGKPDHGRINADWDHWVLDHIARADVGATLRLGWARSSAMAQRPQEIRNWIAANSAPCRLEGEVLAYDVS